MDNETTVKTTDKTATIKTTPIRPDPAWHPGWDYLTNYNYYRTNKPFSWMFINFVRRTRGLYGIAKALTAIKRNGIREIPKIFVANGKSHISSLKSETQLTKSERQAQENTSFPTVVKISIITALHNTPEQFLREMIESVTSQTYGNWELCLADGSDNKHEYVGQICKERIQKDGRIKYRKIEEVMEKPEILNKAIEISTGDFIGILDGIDLLCPSALYEAMKAICGEKADFIYTDEAVFSKERITFKHYKPDFAIDTLCSCNYIEHFTVFSRELMKQAGTFREEYNGSHDYDLILRYTDVASKICHIPKLLYFRRKYENSASPEINEKLHTVSAGENAILDHLKKRGIPARVENKFGLPGFYRIIFELKEKPLVSIIIPNKDNIPLLRNCLSTITEKTTYTNYEIIIVENNSTNDATFAYYEELKRYENISVVHWQGKGFSYSEICNFGAQFACGKHLLFLNNDIMIITPNWIEEMLMYSQRSDVGMVGSKLYFLNGAIQHAGVVLGLGGIAGHIYLGAPYDEIGFMAKLQIVQNMSAVTAACMMIRRTVFDEVGHFTPEFCDSFNDIDLCLKIRNAGYLIVWTPYAEAFHLESKSRGYLTTSRKVRKLIQETALFNAKWGKALVAGDPYYNSNFSLERADYSLK